MFEEIINFDILATNFLKNIIPHNFIFDSIFYFFSFKGSAIFIWIFVLIIILIIEEKKYPGISKNDKNFFVVFILSILLSLIIVEYPLKNLFKRPRPNSNNQHQFLLSSKKCPTNYSFPSSHAAIAFAATTILIFFDKKRRLFYYTLAFLICYSRIYLGCHFFFDVFFGAFLGNIIARLTLILNKYFNNLKNLS